MGRGRIIVGNKSRMVNEDIVNIICWPVNLGYFVKIWSWVEFVRPSIRRLVISVERRAIELRETEERVQRRSGVIFESWELRVNIRRK